MSQLEPFGSTGGLAAAIINAFGGLTANQSIRRVLEAWQHNQTGLEAPEVWQQQSKSVTALVRHCLVISLGPSAAAAVTEAIVRKTQSSNNLSFQQREAWNISKLFCFAATCLFWTTKSAVWGLHVWEERACWLEEAFVLHDRVQQIQALFVALLPFSANRS